MPFGIGKKGGDDDSNRNALFGNRKKADGLPSGPKQNPYAQQSADPYAQQNAPPPYSGGGGNEYRDNKSPSAFSGAQRQGGYGGLSSQSGGDRYGGGGSYGQASGYGSQDRYGGGPPSQPAGRQGGYGGLGRTTSQDTMSTDAGRNELFGGAAQRYEQQKQQPGYGQSGAYGSTSGGYGEGGYGSGPSYGDRELTAEEQEEEDVSATKSEIKFMKQQDVASTRNALRLAQQAEESGRATLERLGAQGERIHNTEKNLDLASNQNRIAEEKARELKTLNRSMFAMHVGNPFTSKARSAERDQKIMDTHRNEREQRDASRKAAWETQARGTAFSNQMAQTKGSGQKSTLADRAKYQFEADSEDDEMENEIDSNLDALHGAAKRLNMLGRAMGEEVDTQNKHIDRIIGKTDKVDDQIAMNRARLDRIH